MTPDYLAESEFWEENMNGMFSYVFKVERDK